MSSYLNASSAIESRSVMMRERASSVPRLIYAGHSGRRVRFLQDLMPDTEVVSMAGGDEPDIPHVGEVAEGKIRHVLEALGQKDIPLDLGVLPMSMLALFCMPDPVISADARTKVPKQDENGVIDWKSYGKPSNVSHLLDMFEGIQRAESNGKPPCYSVDAGAAIQHGWYKDRKKGKLVVGLLPEASSYLASITGFEDYLSRFKWFYGCASLYGSNELCPTDISAGISLPVLEAMKVVQSVNNVNRGDKGYFEALKRGIYTAAVGFHPEILKTLHPDPEKFIREWPWLQEVTKRCYNAPI